MEIQKKYMSKYLHDIAIEQIAEEYTLKGYVVTKEEKLGKYQADLIARKGIEQIVIEVKAGKMTSTTKEKLSGLADYINNLGGYKFFVVVATTPTEKKLNIDRIEQLISDYMHSHLPSELDELSTHTRPDEIVEIDIDEISISGESIFVGGYGVVSINLQFGSDGDQDRGDVFIGYDNFPFEFKITLAYNNRKVLEIVEVNKFKVDTSSYYDNEP